ncbi:MAG: hypothetical protein WC053_06795 [Sideroxydans sp.]|jgi:membrane-associated HD superfamily phosphohydrolase
MNRKQRITLWVGLFNVAFLLLFPPFDSLSVTGANALIFAGFSFVFSHSNQEVINTDVLFLEMVVLLVNVGIAWLLFRDARSASGAKHRFNVQNAILIVVAVNLTVILLFPPFENVFEVSRALIPTFQGFYFIFSADPMHAIIVPVLYEEVVFVLFNGALLWLFFRKEKSAELTPKQAMELMRKISGKH